MSPWKLRSGPTYEQHPPGKQEGCRASLLRHTAVQVSDNFEAQTSESGRAASHPHQREAKHTARLV